MNNLRGGYAAGGKEGGGREAGGRGVEGRAEGGRGVLIDNSSPLSLLVHAAADSRNGGGDVGVGAPNNPSSGHGDRSGSSHPTLFLQGGIEAALRRGIGVSSMDMAGVGGGAGIGDLTLEEQIILQQQLQGNWGGVSSHMGQLLGQLQRSDPSLLNRLGNPGVHLGLQQQQQQLATLLGWGGSAISGTHPDVYTALAHRLRQQQHQAQSQLTQADLLALSRTSSLGGLGAFGGLGVLAGGMGSHPYGASSFGASADLDGIHRMEDGERHRSHLLMNAAKTSGPPLVDPSAGVSPPMRATVPSPATDHHIDKTARNGRDRPTSLSISSPNLNRAGRFQTERKSREPKAQKPMAPSLQIPPPPVLQSEVSPSTIGDQSNNNDELDQHNSISNTNKAPGSVIVPCRARGMPMDHNFKTAYFVIPENVKHGEELICSYFACRTSGIKFRYCSYCQVPVAKRNFRNRHKHGIGVGGNDEEVTAAVNTGEESDGDDELCIPAPLVMKQRIPSVSKDYTNLSRKNDREDDNDDEDKEESNDEILSVHTDLEVNAISKAPVIETKVTEITKYSHLPSSSSSSSATIGTVTIYAAGATTDTTDTTSMGSKNKYASVSAIDAAADGDGDVNNVVNVSDKDEDDRRKRWMDLLEKRPNTKHGEKMSKWLMEVLVVSDFRTPLFSGETALPDGKESSNDASTTVTSTSSSPLRKNGDMIPLEYQRASNELNPPIMNSEVSPMHFEIQKKRQIYLEKGGDNDQHIDGDSEFYVSGSFAAWKERKKAKKQAKGGSSGIGVSSETEAPPLKTASSPPPPTK